VSRNEALEWGHFRGEGLETRYTPDVALGERGRFTPLATEPGAVRLNEVFASGLCALEQEVTNPFERAMAFFLFGSLQQFFFDGNKPTSRFMMNGMLMMEGIDAISIPAIRATEFNSRMVDFYANRDATAMMAFVLDCHPEVARIRELNPELPAVNESPAIKYFRLEDSLSPGEQPAHPPSLAETQRKARENWRSNYYDKRTSEPQPPARGAKQSSEREVVPPGEDIGPDIDQEH
jgi:hypothetical protein